MSNAIETAVSMTPDQAMAVARTGLHALATMRWFTMKLIENLTPDQWMRQVSPGANHIMFNVGHIAYCDAGFLAAAGGATDAVPTSYKALFDQGCLPSERAADYPEPAELLGVLQRAREDLTSHLAGLSGARLLDAPADERLADVSPMIAQLPGFITLHEGTHAGQILLIRRSLGLPGVLGG